jgi:hypothetical protein
LLVDPHWQELPDEYKKALIYVNPTTHVYQPIELLEAMACGCIPISFKDTPCDKLFNSRRELSCYPNELNMLIKHISELDKGELEEMAICSFEDVSFYNHDSHFIYEWNKLLKDAVGVPFRGKE